VNDFALNEKRGVCFTMKIHGPNHSNFNLYKKQLQSQAEQKKEIDQQDRLEISNRAKQLQENNQPSTKRKAYVQDIKKQIESGKYQVNHEVLAKKMFDFWSKQ